MISVLYGNHHLKTQIPPSSCRHRAKKLVVLELADIAIVRTASKTLFFLVTQSRRVSDNQLIAQRVQWKFLRNGKLCSCLKIFTVCLSETLFTIPQIFRVGLTNRTYLSKFNIFACHKSQRQITNSGFALL
jgi:hypothetical protein